MCFNEQISWLTLIISLIATTTCLSYIFISSKNHPDKNKVISLILLWQYAALMQLPEALAWRKLNKKSSVNIKTSSILAFFLNITQPIIAFTLIYYLTKPKYDTFTFGLSFSLNFLYICFWIYALLFLQNWSWNIKPLQSCEHLNLAWWKNNNFIVFLYLLAIISSCMMLGLKYFIFSTIIFIGTLLLSNYFYKCGVGSIWCWIAAFMGIITTLFHITDKYLYKQSLD